MAISDPEILHFDDTFVDGAVDYKGRTVLRSESGGWRSAGFIICVEVAERLAYYGTSVNLISFLTGPLGQSTAAAAENVNVWSGTAALLPLLGAFVADSCLGRYRTVVLASVLYVLGLGLLTLSAILLPSNNMSISTSPSQFQVVLFFFSLYMVAFAQGGHKPCVQAFGADQFDGKHPAESKSKSSFFNWWYFGLCAAALGTNLIISYIQENFSWGLGFAVPCIAMIIALSIFLIGTKTYRFTNVMADKESPFVRIGRVFVAAIKNCRAPPMTIELEELEDGDQVLFLPQSSEQFKFLNKALLATNGSKEGGKTQCSTAEVEEAKDVLRLVPIWLTCLAYAVVFSQSSTFFTKQGATMKRTIVPGFDIPAAALQSFIAISIIAFLPIYDRLLVPMARKFTGKPSGFTVLQRIGIGMVVSALSMAVAASVETRRLETAREHGVVDMPDSIVPMSVLWLVPQYILLGVADVFAMVGLQEFFYGQVPDELRSVGLALYHSLLGVGSFLSSFLISFIDEATGGIGQDSWFSSNLNRGHLDYFYGLLAGLSATVFVAYLYFATSYVYKV